MNGMTLLEGRLRLVKRESSPSKGLNDFLYIMRARREVYPRGTPDRRFCPLGRQSPSSTVIQRRARERAPAVMEIGNLG
jgi:hypothetical protein